jgi:hypothetical protein
LAGAGACDSNTHCNKFLPKADNFLS